MKKDTYKLYDKDGNLIKETELKTDLPVRKREDKMVNEWLYNDMDDPEVEKGVFCVADDEGYRCRIMYPKINKKSYTEIFNKDEEGEKWGIYHLWKSGEDEGVITFKEERKNRYISDTVKRMLLNQDFGKKHISSKNACNIDPRKIMTNIEQGKYNELGRLAVNGNEDLCQYSFVYDRLSNDKIEPHSISLDCFYYDLEAIEEECL